MRNTILLLVFLVLGSINFQGQTLAAAKVVWERYKVGESRVSFLFPKMPTVHDVYDPCGHVDVSKYVAYAEGSIYEVLLTGRSVGKPMDCFGRSKVIYTRETLNERLALLRKSSDGHIEKLLRIGECDFYQFTTSETTRWIAAGDLSTTQWAEIAVVHYPEAKPDASKILSSLKTDADEGIEIGNGSDITLGDATDIPPGPFPDIDRGKTPFKFYLKPKAPYTDAARTANVQGSVKMKVTFMANGGIAVTPLSELPHGMTESAVSAAKKISFLPVRVNGVPVSQTRLMEYSFSMY